MTSRSNPPKRISDAELMAYALRYLADDCEDHRPKTAKRMRDLADAVEAGTWPLPSTGRVRPPQETT
jgi:hypothetical protein